MMPTRDVLVVTGAGSIGRSVATQLGPGRTLVLGDSDEHALDACRLELADQGLDVRAHHVDVTDAEGVKQLARSAAALGPVRQLVHTAGVMPEQADVPTVLRVNLVGTARVLEEFGRVIEPGGAAVAVAGLAGHMALERLSPDQEIALAVVPADDLLEMFRAQPSAFRSPVGAYAFAKHANLLRVRATATAWRERGARVNSVSPGILATTMGHQELTGTHAGTMRRLAGLAPAGRLGTAMDVARAVEFLLDPRSSYITGTDLLVDGGVMAAVQMDHTPA